MDPVEDIEIENDDEQNVDEISNPSINNKTETKEEESETELNEEEGSVVQSYKGVSIHFDAENWLVPSENDYCQLINEFSKVPPDNLILFRNRVGIARVALLALVLGVASGFHFCLLILTSSYTLQIWSLYSILICVYHWSEFLVTCYHHPHSATFDSFLVNQSLEFGIAIVVSWIEFWLEVWLIPSMKTNLTFVSVFGLVIVCIGQCIRTTAMMQAGPSFTHMIAHHREPRHDLITHGLYRVWRHPGYFGWFYWSIGTQLLLCNPLCTIAYFIVSQRFFASRIPIEEANLIKIFGHDYVEYKARTWIGIPGIPQ
jgi:protein-S-isoprenylcysteine O-methyltransferase